MNTVLTPLPAHDTSLSGVNFVKPRTAVNESLTLTPITATDAFVQDITYSKRDIVTRDTITPTTNVTLLYSGVVDTTAMYAQINATMAYPSVLLEDIGSVVSVDCSTESVNVTFDSAADFALATAAWGSSAFVLFTNHLGDCDTENERGLYLVESFESDATTFSVIASSTKTTFNNDTAEAMEIGWTKPASVGTTKRTTEISETFAASLPAESFALSTTIDGITPSLSIEASGAELSGSFAMSGHATWTWYKFAFTDFYIDVDLAVSAGLDVAVNASVAYDSDVYTYSPGTLSISAFSIPGILTVGPTLAFSLGVEVAVSGEVEIEANMTASITDGNVHLDLVDSSLTTTSGWTPVYTYSTNITAAVEAQVNPYVTVTAEIAVDFLSGLLNLSSGVTAEVELLNVFDIEAEISLSNTLGVVIPTSTNDTCINGLWYDSSLEFVVTGFVTEFYSATIYEVNVPIYDTGCWTFAAGGLTEV